MVQKQLNSFQEIQKRLIQLQEETLEDMHSYYQSKLKFYIKQHNLIPKQGIRKSNGEKVIVWVKEEESTPQAINYGTKDMGEEYIQAEFIHNLKQAEQNAVPQTGVDSTILEKKDLVVDNGNSIELTSEIGKSGKKEWSRKRI